MNTARGKSYKVKVVAIVINKRQCNIFCATVKKSVEIWKNTEQWIRRNEFSNYI